MGRLLRRLKYVLFQRRLERDLASEIEHHRALLAESNRDVRALGNVTLAVEDARAVWIRPSVESISRDVSYAVRSLWRQPGFTIVAVGALAAGIGLNTAIFSIFNALSIRSWPVRDTERVVTVFNMSPRDLRIRGGGAPRGFSLSEIEYLAANVKTAVGFVATRSGGGDHTLGEDDTPVSWVSGSYFSLLGVEMARGRGFVPEEDRREAPAAVAVISYAYWQRRFSGDPSIVGREAAFEDIPFTIVGITSRTFTGTTPNRVDVWIPLASVPILRPDEGWVRGVLRQPANCCVSVAARLAPGVTRDQAQAELTVLHRQFRNAVGPEDFVVVSGTQLTAGPKGDPGNSFVLMFAGVLIILALACANVGNLLIARGAARRREIAVRLSLGASRTRIVRQLLTESAVLAFLGGAAGLLAAVWLPRLVLPLIAPRAGLATDPDLPVVAFAAGLSALSTVLFGLAPALHATRGTLSAVMTDASHGGSRLVLRNALLAVQVLAATVLLASAALISRAVYDATTRNLGYSMDRLSTIAFVTPARGFNPARVEAVALQLAADLAPLDDAGSIALTSTSPLASGNIKGSFRVAGQPDEENNAVYEVSPAFFRILGIPIVAGRGFTQQDNGTSAIVVNESLARKFWTVGTAVGMRLTASGGWNRPGELEIIGVARNAGMTGLVEEGPVIYQTLSGRSVPQVLVATADRASAEAAIAAAQRIEPRLRPVQQPLVDNLAPHVRSSRVAAATAGGLGGLALVLAAIGMFGVFAYWVQQRTREIGIRMALGARPAQVVASVLQSSALAIGIGAIAGLAAALMTSRLLRSYLFGLSPLDPAAYAAVVGLLALAASFATFVPARRATRVDPVKALRCE